MVHEGGQSASPPKPPSKSSRNALGFQFIAPRKTQALSHILEHVDFGVIGPAASLLGRPRCSSSTTRFGTPSVRATRAHYFVSGAVADLRHRWKFHRQQF
jgi:hypothetical protein